MIGRRHPSLPSDPGRTLPLKLKYERTAPYSPYLATWDVHRANLFERVERTTGIEPSGRLVAEVMGTEPNASARRVS